MWLGTALLARTTSAYGLRLLADKYKLHDIDVTLAE